MHIAPLACDGGDCCPDAIASWTAHCAFNSASSSTAVNTLPDAEPAAGVDGYGRDPRTLLPVSDADRVGVEFILVICVIICAADAESLRCGEVCCCGCCGCGCSSASYFLLKISFSDSAFLICSAPTGSRYVNDGGGELRAAVPFVATGDDGGGELYGFGATAFAASCCSYCFNLSFSNADNAPPPRPPSNGGGRSFARGGADNNMAGNSVDHVFHDIDVVARNTVVPESTGSNH